MTDLTLPQRIEIAGRIARIMASHGSDVASLVTDAEKAMTVAAEIHGAIDAVTTRNAPKPPAAAAPIPLAEVSDTAWVHPEHPLIQHEGEPPQRLSAHRAAYHVAQNGLSADEQAIFNRASGAASG